MGKEAGSGKLTAEENFQFLKFALEYCPIAVFWIGEDAEFLYANSKACENLGYSSEEITGMAVPDVDPWFNATEWPHHWKELQENKTWVFETRHRARDGSSIPVIIYANLVKIGDREFNCAFAFDVTELREVREERVILDQSFNIVFTNFPDPIFILDDRGRIARVNPEARKLLGYGEEELMGRILNEFMTPESSEHFSGTFNSVLSEDDITCEIEYITKSGDIIKLECVPKVVTDENDEIVSVVVFQKHMS